MGSVVAASSVGLFTLLTVGCAAAVKRHDRALADRDFFPLTPSSRWEYRVSRRTDGAPLRFVATVQPDEFMGPHGHGCRVVDERYGDRPADGTVADRVLHRGRLPASRDVARVPRRIARGQRIALRRAQFLPLNLAGPRRGRDAPTRTSSPDGSGFEVRQLHQVYVQKEPVEVPAGRFERCARVETTAIHSATGPDGSAVGTRVVYYYSDWYAPGVGLVRTEQRSATAEVLATVELARLPDRAGSRRQ